MKKGYLILFSAVMSLSLAAGAQGKKYTHADSVGKLKNIIANSNTIYVLEKGKIVEQGDHDELVNRKGLYYAMWRQQIGERKVETFTTEDDDGETIGNEQ